MRENNTEQFKCLLLEQKKAIADLKDKLQLLISESEDQEQLALLNTHLLIFLLKEIKSLQLSVLRSRFRK